MASEAVDLFMAALAALQRRQQDGEAPPDAAPDDDEAARRKAWFVADFVTVMGDPAFAESWDPENLATEAVFASFTHLAQAYLQGAEDDRRPFLRGVMGTVRDLAEDPDYIHHILPLLTISPGERWQVLAHAGLHFGAVQLRNEASWPVDKATLEATMARLTAPELKRGASFHVKHLKDHGLVTISKKPRFYKELSHTPSDTWLFVKLTDEAQRFLACIGFK